MPPSATKTIAVSPATTTAPRSAPRAPALPRRRDGWRRTVAILTDPRVARAHLHELDLGGNHRTWA